MAHSKIHDAGQYAPPPGFVRALGCMEGLFDLGHEEVGCWMLVNALHLVSKEPTTKELITEALLKLQAMAPNLRWRLDMDTSSEVPKKAFFHMEEPVVDFEVIESSDWKELMEKEIVVKFDAKKGPLWRVKYMPNVKLNRADVHFPCECVIMFAFHHAIIDGMSYQRLFGRFLDCLTDIKHGTKENVPELPVMPALDHFMEQYVSTDCSDGLFTGITRLISRSSWLTKKVMASTMTGENPFLAIFPPEVLKNPDIPNTTSFIPLEFTREETLALVAACKANKVTVHGAAHAAATIGMAMLMQGGHVTKSMKLKSVAPVNLRRIDDRLNLDCVGVYMQVLHVEVAVPANAQSAFWDIARECVQQIHTAIDSKKYVQDYKELKFLDVLQERQKLDFKSLANLNYGRSAETLTVTNMGRCDFLSRSNDADFKIAARFAMHGDHVFGGIFTHNMVTFNDQLFWSLIHVPRIVSKERAETYGEYIRGIIRENTGS